MTQCIPTPASCAQAPIVAVLGAGIAGLTAAQELVERGFQVTVYEPRRDERNGIVTESPGYYPPVKLGGLAASQYSTVGDRDGSPAELRPFPDRRGTPQPPSRAIAGEHGFRFFPAYYLHTWDLFQRIPTYEPVAAARGDITWQPTPRTVLDNVKRVITQGTTVAGHENLVFPREAPRSPVELRDVIRQLRTIGFTEDDITKFSSRILRYLVTSPLRRSLELQNISAYDYFVGRDKPGDPRRITYSPGFEKYLLEMPRVLAAFDSRWGDARTNITTFLQLQLQLDRRDNKADGVLNGPTTESWFDHWYRHLRALGVQFAHTAVSGIDALDPVSDLPPHLRPRVRVRFTDGRSVTPDYVVVAVDAAAAERVTAPLRASGTGGTVAGLDGFTTSAPPLDGPLKPGDTRANARRDPYAMDQMGVQPWDRFQTLAGIQFFFDTEFQLIRGHMYYSGSEWGLSSINQHGLWEKRPTLRRDGHVSVLSVDIGDFNAISSHLGKAARECSADEIAAEVWRQIATAVTDAVDNVPDAILPWPSWYAIDQGLIMEGGTGQGGGRPVRNMTPYLVPIVGDWTNRPGPEPWNPHDTSLQYITAEDEWLEDLYDRDVWQARHGGYQVHNNAVVLAGTWTRTFTRMTSMEAAGESGRHAVNAILDHYVWVASGGADLREVTSLKWRFPFGFIDQGFSSPVRMPSPAGDYCYVFDIENREPAETRALRILDAHRCDESLPHPIDYPIPLPVDLDEILDPPPNGDPTVTPTPPDPNQDLLVYLNALRQLLEPLAGAAPIPPTTAGVGWPATATAAPSQNPAPPPAPGDYAQQLFGYLQAWRQYLERSMKPAAPEVPESPVSTHTGPPAPGHPPAQHPYPAPAYPRPSKAKNPQDDSGTQGNPPPGDNLPSRARRRHPTRTTDVSLMARTSATQPQQQLEIVKTERSGPGAPLSALAPPEATARAQLPRNETTAYITENRAGDTTGPDAGHVVLNVETLYGRTSAGSGETSTRRHHGSAHDKKRRGKQHRGEGHSEG